MRSGISGKGAPILILTTTGRRAGKETSTPLIFGEDGDNAVIVASKGGAPEHPGWYRNLAKTPEVGVQIKGDRFRARARTAEGEERDAALAPDERHLAAVRLLPGEDGARDSRSSCWSGSSRSSNQLRRNLRCSVRLGSRLVDRIGGIGVGIAVGWNIAILGPIATRLAHAYDVSLTTIGLFLTVQFVVHMAMQVPGGRAADRWGARNSALLGLALIVVGNAVSLPAPHAWLAFLGRAIVGLGTGFGLVSGSDYIRSRGGSALLQGIYGGGSVLAPGIALAVVPPLADWLGWRAGYLSAIVVAAVCMVLLALAPASARTLRHAGERLDRGFFRDRRLYRLGAIHAMSFGFSVVVGNWVVTLLEHHGHSKSVCGDRRLADALARLFHARRRRRAAPPRDAARWIAASLMLGGLGAIVLALPLPLAALVVDAAIVGLAAGLPFAMAFTGAAQARPDAPGAAVGFVNALGVARDRRWVAARRPDVLAPGRRADRIRRPRHPRALWPRSRPRARLAWHARFRRHRPPGSAVFRAGSS